jgi:hypothetical protein
MTRSYHTTASGTDTAPDWRGISHARMPRSTFQVGPSAFKLLATIRRIMRDGETRHDLSNADWARHSGLAESTVVGAMRELHEVGLIARERQGQGRGRGYATTLLPPPEIVAARPAFPPVPQKGSESDPSPDRAESPRGAPETPTKEGSDSDPSLHLVHDSIPPPTPPVAGGGGASLARSGDADRETVTETEQYLLDEGFGAPQASEFRDLDPAAVRRAWKKAQDGGTHQGGAVLAWRRSPPRPAPSRWEAPPSECAVAREPSALPDPEATRRRLEQLAASNPQIARLAAGAERLRAERERRERLAPFAAYGGAL